MTKRAVLLHEDAHQEGGPLAPSGAEPGHRPSPRRPEQVSPRKSPFRVLDLLLPGSLILWVIACNSVNPDALNDWGLFPALPVIFYLSLALLVTSITVTLTGAKLSPVRLTLHLVALVLVLHGTVPLIFRLPNYPWTYKHIGVTRYIGLQGRLDASIDIYHSWPGFFAVAAWFTKIAGVRTPMAYAAWAPVYFNLTLCLLLNFAFRSLRVSPRVRFLGLFLFVPANWVGQDYFAPQALAFVASVAVLAMALAWLQVNQPIQLVRRAGRLVAPVAKSRGGTGQHADRLPPFPVRSRIAPLAAIFSAFAVVVVSHQLSPYMVLIGLALVTVAGFVRPRWVVLVLVAMTAAYLIPRFGYLERNHSLLDSLFNPLANLGGNDFGNTRGQPGRQLAFGAPALVLGMWSLGLLGVARRLREGRPTLVPALLAASPVLIALVQSYGGEAIFRIYLFSLPWTAVLAASALEPARGPWGRAAGLKIGAVLSVAVVLFMAAFYGAVELYRVRPGEVQASQYFYDHAQPGSVLVLTAARFPGRVAANYDEFVSSDSTPNLLAPENGFRRKMLGPDDLPAISRFVQQYTNWGPGRVYLVLSKDQQVYAEVLGLVPEGSLDGLERALPAAPDWRLFYRNDDAVIYEFTPSLEGDDEAPALAPAPRPSPDEQVSADIAALGAGLVGLVLLVLVTYRRGRTMDLRRIREILSEEDVLEDDQQPDEVVLAGAPATTPDVTHVPVPVGLGELLTRTLVGELSAHEPLVVALTGGRPEPDRVPEIVAAVETRHRAEALRLLAQAWGPLSSADLHPLLQDPSGPLRAAAVEVVQVNPGDERWLHTLLADDLSAAVRVAAARALAQAPEADRLTALRTALSDPDPAVRATATEALALAEVRWARLLLAAGEDGHPAVRRAAHGHLAKSPSWILWMALGQSSRADELLSLLEAEAPDRLTALVAERILSPEPADRIRAIALGGRLDTPLVTQEILAAAGDPDAGVRLAAVNQLRGRLEGVATLVRALQDGNRDVRLAAAGALDGIDHDDAVTALIGALQDPDHEIRQTAIELLVRRSSAGLARRVAETMTRENSAAVKGVLERLGDVGEDALAARIRGEAAQARRQESTGFEFSRGDSFE